MTVDPARLVLAGFLGTRADDATVRPLAALGVGGYVVFARNVETPSQVRDLLEGLTDACPAAPLLAVDQEGGRVARLKAPLTVWPAMARLGEADDVDLARAVGEALASEIGAVGFNLAFTPVLDVRFEGTTDAIGDRSLGDHPGRVAALGSALIQGIQAAGLAACAKHFPGHGHVTIDSHLELPVCDLDADTLRRDHAAPFGRAVEAGVDAVMTAHVLYPHLDPTSPATLSEPLVTGLLRKELGFRGVVLTDDMEMGAIAKRGGIPEACAAAIRAGVDGVLVCRDLDAVDATVRHLRAEVERDARFAARCDEAAAHLADLAARRPPRPRPADALDDALGPAAHLALARQLRGDDVAGADPTRAHLS